MKVAPLLLLILGCGPKIPLTGPISETPSGYKVSVPESFDDQEITRQMILEWVDLRISQWIREKSIWGLDGYSDLELRAEAGAEIIIVVDDSIVDCDGPANGCNCLGHYIQVCLYVRPVSIHPTPEQILPPNSPLSFSQGRWLPDGIGLKALPHELTHNVLGRFHPD